MATPVKPKRKSSLESHGFIVTKKPRSERSEEDGKKKEVPDKGPDKELVFQESWTLQFSWLTRVDGKMFCRVCRGKSTNKHNAFGNKGSTNFQRSSLVQHFCALVNWTL